MRLADEQSEVLSPEIYKSSWKTRGREALSKVKKYHAETIHSTHRDLVKEVESNPKTLFLIVADEAHVAITKNDEEEDKSTTTPVRKKSKSKPDMDGTGDHKTENDQGDSQIEITAR